VYVGGHAFEIQRYIELHKVGKSKDQSK
jgi:hypothetical protein